MLGTQKVPNNKREGRSLQAEERVSAKGLRLEQVHCTGGLAKMPADQNELGVEEVRKVSRSQTRQICF